MTTDERLADITEMLSNDDAYDWIEDMHWLLALCRKQREALRAVDEEHRADCPVTQIADTPSNVETHCTCHVAKVRAALEEEP